MTSTFLPFPKSCPNIDPYMVMLVDAGELPPCKAAQGVFRGGIENLISVQNGDVCRQPQGFDVIAIKDPGTFRQ